MKPMGLLQAALVGAALVAAAAASADDARDRSAASSKGWRS